METSRFAKKQTKKASSIKEKSLDRLAEKAFKNGITHAETTGGLNRYITSVFFANTNASNIRIYSELVFVFAGEVLVTTFKLPNKYKKIVSKINKKKSNKIDFN